MKLSRMHFSELFAATILMVSIVSASTLFSPTTAVSNNSPPFVIWATSAFATDPCPAPPANCGLSGFEPFQAFNHLSLRAWTGMHNDVDALKLDLGVSTGLWILTDYKFTETSTTRAPNTWTIQGSTDDITYIVLDTRSGITWTANETKTFNVNGGITTAFRYFRFNSTATNGDATFTEILDLQYSGTLFVGGVKHKLIKQ